MKAITIALKDMRQSYRSFIALAFMFGVPILVTGMFYLMLGGTGDSEEFSLPKTRIQIVNLDQGSPQFSETFGESFGGSFETSIPESFSQTSAEIGAATSMGDVIVGILMSEAFVNLMDITISTDASSARSAVDAQEIGVAIIIPENFTDVLVAPDGKATIELYQDPTLTLGPSIVKGIMRQLIDSFVSTKIGIDVVLEQLNAAGVPVDGAKIRTIAGQFLESSNYGGQGSESTLGEQLLEVKPPAVTEQADNSSFTFMISMILGAMMVFYAFFTGAASAQSIIREDEKGTLPRLFTTPTPQSTIFSGKFLAIGLTILVQVCLLMLFGKLVFGIHWGEFTSISLVTLAMVACASAFGIFLASFLKTTRQAGVIFGGVLTVTGILGMISVFTINAPAASQISNTLPLIAPQGWAMRGLRLSMDGDPLRDIAVTAGVMFVLSLIFFVVGNNRLKKRFI